jgi:hypothetical protein
MAIHKHTPWLHDSLRSQRARHVSAVRRPCHYPGVCLKASKQLCGCCNWQRGGRKWLTWLTTQRKLPGSAWCVDYSTSKEAPLFETASVVCLAHILLVVQLSWNELFRSTDWANFLTLFLWQWNLLWVIFLTEQRRLEGDHNRKGIYDLQWRFAVLLKLSKSCSFVLHFVICEGHSDRY